MSAPSGFSVLRDSLAEMNGKLYHELAMNLPTIADSDSSSDDGSSIDLVFSGHWDEKSDPPHFAQLPAAPTPQVHTEAAKPNPCTPPATAHEPTSDKTKPSLNGDKPTVRLPHTIKAVSDSTDQNISDIPAIRAQRRSDDSLAPEAEQLVSSSEIVLNLDNEEKPGAPMTHRMALVRADSDDEAAASESVDSAAVGTVSSAEQDSEPSSSDDESTEEDGELRMQGWLSGAAGRLASRGGKGRGRRVHGNSLCAIGDADKAADVSVAEEAEAAFQAAMDQPDAEIVAEELKASGQEGMPMLDLEVNLLAGMDLDGLLQRLQAKSTIDWGEEDASRPQLTWNIPPAESLFLSDDEDDQ